MALQASQSTRGRCVGVDKPDAVAYATSRYPAANLEFVAGDLCDPECGQGHFDLIVSFDVIEHVLDIESYLRNIAAQLDPERGVALISTPWSSRRVNRWPLHNAHHVEELSLDDFLSRLSGHFAIEDVMLTIGAMAVLRHSGTTVEPLERRVLHVPLGIFLALERDYERTCRALEQAEPVLDALRGRSSAMSEQDRRRDRGVPPERHRDIAGNTTLERLDDTRAPVSAELLAMQDGLSGLRFLPGTYHRPCTGTVTVRMEELAEREAAEVGVPPPPDHALQSLLRNSLRMVSPWKFASTR